MVEKQMKCKIAVAGTGYAGLFIAILLAQHNYVTAVDVVSEKVDLINRGESSIRDEHIVKYLAEKELNLTATMDGNAAYSGAEFVVIATSANYDSKKNHFDISSVESVTRQVMGINPDVLMIIKSTVPVGYTAEIRERMGSNHILFSPEFLRESKALYDNLYPSRIIVFSDGSERGNKAMGDFAAFLQEGAEADKLFANTYLALRMAYFNELDTHAEMKGLDTRAIIEGVCLNPRIGSHYNNPSFGYG